MKMKNVSPGNILNNLWLVILDMCNLFYKNKKGSILNPNIYYMYETMKFKKNDES